MAVRVKVDHIGLYAKDLDRRNGTLTVLHGKGDRRRTVGLDPGAFAIVERWIDKRREMGLHGRQRLFCTLRGSPIKSAYVRALLPRLARKAGIEKRVHAHALRHTPRPSAWHVSGRQSISGEGCGLGCGRSPNRLH